MQFHIGHARTLLLGSLICEEKGIPFHVRLDGPVSATTGDRGNSVLDTVDMLNTLQIRYDRLYWSPQTIPPKHYFDRQLLENADAFWWAMHTPEICPDYYRMLMVDDVVFNNPSLIIRGMDFVTPSVYCDDPVMVTGTERHIVSENLMYAAAGRVRQEINTPMVMIDQEKMSKSMMRIVHWGVLASIPIDLARDFLIATATHPHDPLAHLGEGFSQDKMSAEPFVWSWEIWNELVRRT